jgi:hypothetical protein
MQIIGNLSLKPKGLRCLSAVPDETKDAYYLTQSLAYY